MDSYQPSQKDETAPLRKDFEAGCTEGEKETIYAGYERQLCQELALAGDPPTA
jgi:hypothetical protein